MTLVLWTSTGPALESMQIKGLDDEFEDDPDDYLDDGARDDQTGDIFSRLEDPKN